MFGPSVPLSVAWVICIIRLYIHKRLWGCILVFMKMSTGGPADSQRILLLTSEFYRGIRYKDFRGLGCGDQRSIVLEGSGLLSK